MASLLVLVFALIGTAAALQVFPMDGFLAKIKTVGSNVMKTVTSMFDHEEDNVVGPILDDHPVNSDVGLTVLELIKKHGYPIEDHPNVQTPDGYLLDIHRIPHGLNNSHVRNKPVVFLMHGILCSSAEWVNMGPNKGLAYLLADLGYDVWMGNARGNTWSRKHRILDPDRDSSFWDFSWHEIGTIDLPTMIDYVLSKTGQCSLYYIGHSQGTTAFFVMASERPEYNKKITKMVALAPVAYMSKLPNPFFRLIAKFEKTIQFILGLLGVDEFTPNIKLLGLIGQSLCKDQSMIQEVCSNILFLIAGWNSKQLNKTMIPVILTSIPAGAATKQLLHYSQGINSGRFRRYDYGGILNLKKYGTFYPPDYNLKNIRAPVVIFYSGNDWLADVSDVDQLHRELPNVVCKYYMPDDMWNHLDYLFAIDVVPLVYNHVAALIWRP